jgi:hypothetical protein
MDGLKELRLDMWHDVKVNEELCVAIVDGLRKNKGLQRLTCEPNGYTWHDEAPSHVRPLIAFTQFEPKRPQVVGSAFDLTRSRWFVASHFGQNVVSQGHQPALLLLTKETFARGRVKRKIRRFPLLLYYQSRGPLSLDCEEGQVRSRESTIT